MTKTQFPAGKTYTTKEMERMLKDAQLTLDAMWESNLFHDSHLKHLELVELLCHFVLYEKGGSMVFEFLSFAGWADKGECEQLLAAIINGINEEGGE